MRSIVVAAVMMMAGHVWVVYSQQGRATVTGVVTDPSGAAIPAARVTVQNTGTGATFTATTDISGLYTAPSLAVGEYVVTAEKEGFKKGLRSAVNLQVDQRARIDFTMQIGTAAESVEIVAEAPLVDSGAATIGKVVENRRISDLPLNGRNALALTLLTPGVQSHAGPTNSGFADRGIALSAISINGGPGGLNSVVVDGANNNNSYQADVNISPTVDAVEEFKVQSNVMSAEFGFTAGGVINIVTKSGTNLPHGTLYHFLRNDKLDAQRAFTSVKEPFRYNQYGGALGGPVFLPKLYDGKNRSFFFFNTEGWIYRRSQSNIITVPTASQRRGDFSDLRDASGRLIQIYDPATTVANSSGAGFVRTPFPGNAIPTNRFDSISVKYLDFYPLPNRTPSNAFTNANNYIGQVGEEREMQQWVVKGDHKFSDRNNMSIRYNYSRHFNNNGTASPLPDPNVRVRLDNYVNRNAAVTDTHVFSPRVLNELRVSLARQHFPYTAYSYGHDWAKKLGFPDTVPPAVLPRPSIAGVPAFGPFTVGLRGNVGWQFFDMVTFISGKHTFKAGADVRLQRAAVQQMATPSGQFNFTTALTGNPQSQVGTGSGLASFLLGSVSTATIATYGSELQAAFSTSLFFQDDWKVTRRLTVNLGLRFDKQQWPREVRNRVSNFDPNGVNPENGLRGRMTYGGVDFGQTPYEPLPGDFGPRAGFAYDLFGDGKTVIRGGYAIFYPQLFYRDTFGSNAGFATTDTQYNPPGGNTNLPAFRFQDGPPVAATPPLGAGLGPSAFLGQSVTWVQPKEKSPMSQQWTMSMQRQLPGKWLVDASYSANRGSRLVSGTYNLNQLDPKYYDLGLALQDQVPNPYQGRVPGALGAATISRNQSLRAFPYYTNIDVRWPHLGSSTYHAFLLSVEKRLASGIAILTSYTKGKIISDSVFSPDNVGPVEQTTVTGYQNGLYNRRAERSTDPTDVSQRLVVSGVFEVPFGKGRRWSSDNRLINGIAGGWQVNTIGTMVKGLPVVLRGANNQQADRPNSTGLSAKLDNPTPERWFDTSQFINPPLYTFGNVGRVLPDVRNPGTVNFDVSLIKDTQITESLKLQFRAESFNFLNHINLDFVNASFSPGADGRNQSATFGTITSARDARMHQFGLKLIF